MIYTYASSYISGLGKVVETILKDKIKGVQIIENQDGLIIYKTNKQLDFKSFQCFNNTFLVINFENTNSNSPFQHSVSSLSKKIIIDAKNISTVLNIKPNTSFKILCIDKNQPTSIDFSILTPIEKQIQSKLKMKVGFRKHDLDFVFLRRNENIILFALKLTYNRITEKQLPGGALRPELSYLLAYMSKIKSSDIIIDPFCGHGSIPKEIVKHFNYNMVFASDINEILINQFKLEYKKNKKNLFIKQRNALDLSYFKDGFIDKIITDPPWNIFEKTEDNFVEFYSKMLTEFNRILKENGTCTVLMGNIIDFEAALTNSNFKIKDKFHILVNGKKANVYILVKAS